MLKTAAFAICAVVCLPIPALATPWTFTQAGTIRAGQDYGGLFFAPDTALGGKSFSITYLLDPALYPDQIESDPFINYRYGANSGSMTITTTIDNVSRAYVLDPSKYSFGASQLYNYITAGSAGADLAGQLHTGYTSGGDYVSANTVVYSNTNNYHLGLNFDQTWNYAVQAGDFVESGFTLRTQGGDTQFFGAFEGMTFKINGEQPAQVPEPATIPMMIVGLVGLVAALRRKGLLSK